MKYIINGLPVTTGRSCFTACLHNIMANYGYMVSEPDCFFLADGLRYRFRKRCFGEALSPMNRFQFQPFPQLMGRFANAIGVRFGCGGSVEKGTDWERIRNILIHDTPILVSINSDVLDYFPRLAQTEIQEPPHCIILYGFDDIKKYAYIADPYVVDYQGNRSKFKGGLPLEQFKKSILEYFWLELFECTEIKTQNAVRAIKAGLDSFFSEKESEDFLCGACAVRETIWALSNIGEENVRFAKSCAETAFLIRVNLSFINHYLIEEIDRYTTEPEASRQMMAQLTRIQAQWDAFYMKLLKAAYLKSRTLLDRCIQSGDLLLDRQFQLFSELSQAFGRYTAENRLKI